MKKLFFLLPLFFFIACKHKGKKEAVAETATTGTVKILVDESFAGVLADQIEVFRLDYPDTKFQLIQGNENKIVPTFLNDSVRVAVLSRMLSPEETKVYTNRSIRVSTSRFAIDGIALFTGKANQDSTITVEEVISILNGKNPGGRNLVFDNAYSGTVRYFKDLAKISVLPKTGVYTLENNNDVIKYVTAHPNYIGIAGVNWLLKGHRDMDEFIPEVKLMAVKNIKGKPGDDQFYKPDQTNLINGKYPFLRNIYIINAEGRTGLGTGFATWLTSQRGQLIVLKSGLGPNKLTSRDFNLKSDN